MDHAADGQLGCRCLGTIYVVATKEGRAGSILVPEPTASDATLAAEDDIMVPVGLRDIVTTMDVFAKDRCQSFQKSPI